MKISVLVPSLLFFGILLPGASQAVEVCASGCAETLIGAALNKLDYSGQNVYVHPGTYEEDRLVVLNRALIALDPNSLTPTIIDAVGSGNDVIRRAGNNAVIEGFTIRGGRAGIRLDWGGDVFLRDLVIENNNNSTGGGGIQVSQGSLVIIGSTIQNNSSSEFGGAINMSSNNSNLTISDSFILGNTGGSGLYIDPGVTAVIKDTEIKLNTTGSGGGIKTFATTTLINVDLLDNTATLFGGAIYKDAIADEDAALNIYGGTILGNTATKGGGIYLKGSRATLNSFAEVTSNDATDGIAGSSGGGLYCTTADMASVAANSITGNTPGNISSSCGTIGEPVPQIAGTTAEFPAASTNLDPINTFTGELFSRKPADLNLGGPMPLYFQRYYAAYLRRGFILGDLGNNWRHNFDARVNWVGNILKYTTHDGRITEFIKNFVSGDWEQQENLHTPYKVSAEGGQDATIYDPDDNRIYSFDFTTDSIIIGKLVRVEDGHGNQHTISYDLANAQIETISDGLGRTFTFTYNGDLIPKISVVDDGTRSISFEYTDPLDSENLTLAIGARLGPTTYVYEDTSTVADNALMLSMTRPEGNTPYTQTFYDTTTPLSSGRVATQTDADSNIHSLDYSGLDTTLTDPLGNTRVHTHTATGEFSNREDEAGLSFGMGSDATGRRNSLTDRLGGITTIVYKPESGDVESVANADGSTYSYAYTARTISGVTLQDLTGATHADGTTESFGYDTNGNPIAHTDRAGNASSATFNNNGQPLTSTNVAGGITTYTYDTDATLLTTKDPAGNITTFAYDGLKRLDQVIFADNNIRGMTRDNADNLLTITDENSNTVTMTYDTNSNLVTFENALLKTSVLAYDGNDRLLSITDPLNGVISQTFNSIGKLTSITDANSNMTLYGYDTLGRRTSLTDPEGKIWTTTYDAEAIVSSQSDPFLNTSSFLSDEMGRITRITSPLGNVYEVTYDAMGRVISVTDALGNTTDFTRDEHGLLLSVSLPGGVIEASYVRDVLGKITTITDPNGNDWDRTYDNMGRWTSYIDPLDNTISQTYDDRNRPDVLTFPDVLDTLTFGYDLAGNLISSDYSDGTAFSYSYDDINRLTSADGIALIYDDNDRVIDSNGIEIARDAGGRITDMTFATDKTVSYSYDGNGRVTEISDWNAGVITFTYDDAGRLINITRPNNINTIKNYDNDSRLIGIAESAVSTINLTRDANGQITNAIRNVPLSAVSATLADVTNSFDVASQLQSAVYDDMGRVTSEGSNTYVWNLASQLTSVTTASGTATATYDATGKRLSKTVGVVTRDYVWNYALGLTSISISIEKLDGADLRYYVHTPNGRLMYSIEASDDSRRFYHYDEMGNTLFVTNEVGAVIGSYAYSPYGELIVEIGGLDNPFTWQGQHGIMDEGDGLYYIRARYYDANRGRFISRDPVKSINSLEINPYQYALGNPLKYIDITGEQGELRFIDADELPEKISKNIVQIIKFTAALAESRFRKANGIPLSGIYASSALEWGIKFFSMMAEIQVLEYDEYISSPEYIKGISTAIGSIFLDDQKNEGELIDSGNVLDWVQHDPYEHLNYITLSNGVTITIGGLTYSLDQAQDAVEAASNAAREAVRLHMDHTLEQEYGEVEEPDLPGL